MLGHREVLEDDPDARVAVGGAPQGLELTLDLALDDQPCARVLDSPERLQDLGQRLALAEKAGRIEEDDSRRLLRCAPRSAVAPLAGRVSQQLGVDSPTDPRALDPELRVAFLLAGGHRVDDVERSTRGLDVHIGEVLPDEAARGPDPRRAERLDRLETVVLVEEGELELVLAPPGDDLRRRDPVLGGVRDIRLVPDPGVVDERRADVAGAGRPREHERLVPERVERRAKLARDDPLPAVEPVGADPDPHRREGRWRRRQAGSATRVVAFSKTSSPSSTPTRTRSPSENSPSSSRSARLSTS